MPRKSKFEILQDNTFKHLREIKNKVDPRTYASFERNIYNAVGQSALYKLQGKFETIKEMQENKTYTKTAKAKETNKINKEKSKEAIAYFKQPLKEYYVKADVKINITYTTNRKSRFNKNGKKKGEIYEHKFEKPETLHDYSKTITARSEEEAKKMFLDFVSDLGNASAFAPDSLTIKAVKVDSVDNISSYSSNNFESSGPEMMMMKAYKPLKYDFIPSDDNLLLNQGFCVPDQFISTYSKYIKKLDLDYFTQLCYKVRGETRAENIQKSLLDVDIKDDDEDDLKIKRWELSDGVSPTMLTEICKILNISTYAYDITKQCFLKYIAPHRNFPAFVYYAVNDHCYHITNKDDVKSLVEKAKDVDNKIKSNCIKEDEQKKEVNKFKDLTIYEDITIDKLLDYKDCIIVYKKYDLNQELNQIIELHNYIPKKIKNHKFDIVSIEFNYENRNIFLYIDPNEESPTLDYKYIKSECEKLNLEFKNQSFAQMITQLKKRYFDNLNKRHHFSAEERINLWKSSTNKKCAKCLKAIKAKEFEIDHIKPVSIGGTNDFSNLQILCKACHNDKSRSEQEQGYFKSSDTESSFNSITKEIIDSNLYGQYAFIEPLIEKIPKKLNATKIYNIDINKCRKNILYYCKDAYPLFTVMDKPDIYKGQNEPGLYYVETEQYFPFRGNGWYPYNLIKYGLETNLIKSSEIKYVILSSLEVPADYYNGLIDYLYENIDEAKLSVNSMIGNFKPKPREQWKSLLITESASEAFYYHLKLNGSFIDVRNINNKKYYQIYSSSIISKQESDAPIYNQILAQEAIELHKLKCIIEEKGGVCLDLNTDCISCVFNDDIFPFHLVDKNNNIGGYLYDSKKNERKYKLEPKLDELGEMNSRLKVSRMANYKRTNKYQYEQPKWEIINDIETNDFNELVDKIIDSKKSINIDGRAGTGKSTLINMIQAELKKRGISYKCLAPTNKSARVVNGSTIHKFIISSTRKTMTDSNYEYLFIDEISMVHEYFYKFFITLKQIRPNVKFIIAGDFLQLLPVNDRLECDYKNSPALFELCDGRRLQLSKCRRSDDELFNICNPDNVKLLKKQDFTKSTDNLYITNLCYTNAKRKEINSVMMTKFINKQIQTAKTSKKAQPKPTEIKAKLYDDNSQDVKLLKGMPIIARKTTEKYDIMNNETFHIIDINDKIFKITVHDTPIEININEFSDLFYVAFALTIHKSQGQTFNYAYCIHEWEKLDDRLKYVALSRATNKSNIHIN